MPLFSLDNLFAGDDVEVTLTDQDDNYPGPNFKRPEHPDIPAKTTATGVQTLLVNLGGAKAVVGIGLHYVNVETGTWVADDAPTLDSNGGLPQHTSGLLTFPENPGNGRRCALYRPPATITKQYWGLKVPDQEPTDSTSVYRFGGGWGIAAGDLYILRGARYDDEMDPVSPAEFSETKSLRAQRTDRGPEFMGLTGELVARVGKPPFLNDDAATWNTLLRRWWARDFAFYARRADHPAWIGVMRQRERSKWQIGVRLATTRFHWEEVTRT